MLKVCPNCGKEFDAKGPNAKFCNPKCQREFKKKESQIVVEKVCKNCGKAFKTADNRKEYCCEECLKNSKKKPIKTKVCPNCGKVFEPKSNRTIFCCNDCTEIYESKKKFKNDEGVIICKECGMMGNNLLKHIRAKHGSVEDYCEKHHCTRNDLISKKSHNNLSERQKTLMEKGIIKGFTSENNPSKGEDCKNGRNSPYSLNFRGYVGLSNKEKQLKINDLMNKKIESTNENCNNPKRIEYYLSRGYSQYQSEQMLKESQQTFSLDKCIEKYGEEDGKKRWQNRQEQWLKNYPKNNYSKISQTLFDDIMKNIKCLYNEVYYATLNEEYTLKTKNKVYKLDFYIKDNKKVIEFDGDYWHDQNKPGNKSRDEQKTNDILEYGLKLLRVKERDYRKNPEKILQECLDFLKE